MARVAAANFPGVDLVWLGPDGALMVAEVKRFTATPAAAGAAAAVLGAMTRSSGYASHRAELAQQEQLLEAITQWAYAVLSWVLGCGVYFETDQFWSSFAVACGLYSGLAALPRRPLQ